MKIQLLVAASLALLCVGLLVLSQHWRPQQPTNQAPASKARSQYAGRSLSRPAHREAVPSVSKLDDRWDEMSGEERTRHLLQSFEAALEQLESDIDDASARERAESALTLLRAELLHPDSGALGRERYEQLERRLDSLTE